jgi:hypothetical protein
MLCEICGFKTKPYYDGDYPVIYKCLKCGHLELHHHHADCKLCEPDDPKEGGE